MNRILSLILESTRYINAILRFCKAMEQMWYLGTFFFKKMGLDFTFQKGLDFHMRWSQIERFQERVTSLCHQIEATLLLKLLSNWNKTHRKYFTRIEINILDYKKLSNWTNFMVASFHDWVQICIPLSSKLWWNFFVSMIFSHKDCITNDQILVQKINKVTTI